MREKLPWQVQQHQMHCVTSGGKNEPGPVIEEFLSPV